MKHLETGEFYHYMRILCLVTQGPAWALGVFSKFLSIIDNKGSRKSNKFSHVKVEHYITQTKSIDERYRSEVTLGANNALNTIEFNLQVFVLLIFRDFLFCSFTGYAIEYLGTGQAMPSKL